MMRSVRIELNGVPPSLNRFAGRENTREYRQEKETWTRLVAVKAKQARLPEPFDKSDVEIEYFFPDNRRRDPDNYAGKMLLDGLTKGGIIVDDSFDHISLHLARGGVDPKRPRTTITVKEI